MPKLNYQLLDLPLLSIVNSIVEFGKWIWAVINKKDIGNNNIWWRELPLCT
jgi:hypothetical protein